jgi:hypothetical protein
MKIMVVLTEANPDTQYSEDYACAQFNAAIATKDIRTNANGEAYWAALFEGTDVVAVDEVVLDEPGLSLVEHLISSE